MAQADRMIFTPKGSKLRSDQVQLDTFFEGGRSAHRVTYLGLGLGESFDFELTEWARGRDPSRVSLDFSYNFLVPIADLSPGLSVGVQDVFDQMELGRGFYVAVTWKLNNVDPVNADTPLELSIGAGTGRFRGAFVNARFPISNEFRVVTEHDSREIAAGFELVPNRQWRARYFVRANKNYASLSFSARF